MKYLSVILLCLLVSACDFVRPSASVNISSSNIIVSPPDTLFFGDLSAVISISIVNPLDRALYYDGRDVALFFAPNGDAGLRRAHNPAYRADAVPKRTIAPGDTLDGVLPVSLFGSHRADWVPEAFEGGEFVIGVAFYLTPGDEDSNYVGVPAPEEISFSEPFTLTFAEPE